MKDRFDLITFWLPLILIAALGWYVFTLKEQKNALIAEVASLKKLHVSTNSQYQYFNRTVPPFSLPYMSSADEQAKTKSFRFHPDSSEKYHLFIFFTPFDCYSCFQEVSFWNELKNQFQTTMNIVCITTGTSVNRTRHFVTTQEILVPTLYDESGKLFRELDLLDMGITPIKILTAPNGVVIHASKSTFDNTLLQNDYLEVCQRNAKTRIWHISRPS